MGASFQPVLSGPAATARELGTIFLVCLCMLFTQAGVGNGIATLDYVSRTFGIADDPGKQSWLAASYSLLVGTLVLPMGSAGDLLGHKKLVVAGFAFYAFWSLIAGLSTYAGSHIFFDVCRGFQGAGPAMLLPNGVAILGRMYRAGSTRKYLAFCAFAGTAPSGFLVGAVFSGIFVQKTSVGWPLAFYVFAAVLSVTATVSVFVLPSEEELHAIHRRHEEQDRAAEREKDNGDKIDQGPTTMGTATAPFSQTAHSDGITDAASASSTVLHHTAPAEAAPGAGSKSPSPAALKDDAQAAGEAPSSDAPPARHFDWIGALLGVSALLLLNVAWNQGGVVGWSDPQTYVLLILGLLLGVAFVYSSFRLAHPLLPHDVWTGTNALVLGCVSLGWASFGLWSFYAWRFWLVIRQRSVLLATAYMSPAAFTGVVAAFGTGFLLRGLGPGPVLVTSLFFFCLGNVLLMTMPAQQTYWANSFVSMLLTPIGMDTSFPSASIIISDHLPHSRQGQAGSLVNTAINWSIAIGLGVGGTVEHYITRDLRRKHPELDEMEITLRGYRSALYVGAGLAGLGILLSLLNWALIARQAARQPSSRDKDGQVEEDGGRKELSAH
ncbi:hypothetical protein OC842_001457 [Tilletia horrida]|uniref:Major facilitator superfamily (MFS) profile domain-containing protein n=1 Tax=Tilletia horrida TaxID=155126 RepID=A0AAN6JLY7_9BASI|nr:hypothetical protein OC842_001457 [Tilletia horrida]